MSTIKKITYLTTGQGINFLVNLAFMPYMARAMSYADYGTYGQVMLVFSIFLVFFSFGLNQVVFVFLADKNTDPKQVISSNLAASGVSIFLAFLSILLFNNIISVGFNNPNVTVGLEIIKYSFLFSFFNANINAYLIGKGLPEKATIILVISNVLKVLLVIIAVQLFESLKLVFYAILVANFFQFLLYTYSIKNDITLTIPKKKIYQQLKLGTPLALTGIFGMGILQSDSVMVSYSFDVKSYAIYRNGAFEIPFFATLYGSIAAIILPKVAELWKSNELKTLIKLKQKVITNSIAIIYPILFFFLLNSNDIILLYLGEKYQESALIFLIFNLTLLIRINDYFDVMIASGKTKLILYFNMIVFFLNILLNFIFIQIFGLPGAAAATVISLLIYAWMHMAYSIKILECNFLDFLDLKKIILIISLIFAFGLLTSYLVFIFEVDGLKKIILYLFIYLMPSYFLIVKFKLINREIVYKFIPRTIIKLLKLT